VGDAAFANANTTATATAALATALATTAATTKNVEGNVWVTGQWLAAAGEDLLVAVDLLIFIRILICLMEDRCWL
jgi:hypothetical protein